MSRSLPVPQIRLGATYEKKVLKLYMTIDKRNFKVCEPKEIRKRRHLIMETVHIVHVLRGGKVRVRQVR